jgi:small subunit ribosomal protein S8e
MYVHTQRHPLFISDLHSLQYAQPVTKKGKAAAPAEDAAEPVKRSNHAQRNLDEKKKGMPFIAPGRIRIFIPPTEAKIDPLLESQFAAGRLYAAISSRPGQSGRADGYILEGKELEVG